MVAALLGGLLAAGTTLPARQPAQKAEAAPSARIALVPLDDRPRSLADVVRLGAIADAEVVTPPAGMIGRHLKTGDGDAVAQWLDRLDLSKTDAVVVSTDMLAYGGLVGSRVSRVLDADARRRLDALARLKERRGDLPVYAFASLLRLAPTADGGNQKWREALARWAERSPAAEGDASVAAEVATLERALPAGMLDRYRAGRARNVAITTGLVELVARGAVDFLVIGDDEVLERGVHVAERAQIEAAIGKAGVGDRVLTRQGIVDVATLLVARAVLARAAPRPAVAVWYSSDQTRARHGATVVSALRVTGAPLQQGKAAASVELALFASGEGAQAPAETLARRVAGAPPRRVAIADVGTRGSGGPLGLIEVLRARKALTPLAGYAAGPTPEAGISTALAHGLLFAHAVERLAPGRPEIARRVSQAHITQLLQRLVGDVLLAAVVAPQAVDELIERRQMDPAALSDRERVLVEEYIQNELGPLAQSLAADFGASPWRLPGRAGSGASLSIKELADVKVHLPWSQLAEPDLTFTLVATPAAAAPRPPGPRVLR